MSKSIYTGAGPWSCICGQNIGFTTRVLINFFFCLYIACRAAFYAALSHTGGLPTGTGGALYEMGSLPSSGCRHNDNCDFFDLIYGIGTHDVHRITHESIIMTYFQCGPLMTCGGFRVGGGVHDSADWWDLLLPLADTR